MNLQKGDIYICMEPSCGAEIEVRRGANDTCPGKFTLRCCCGNEMAREDMPEHAGASVSGGRDSQPMTTYKRRT